MIGPTMRILLALPLLLLSAAGTASELDAAAARAAIEWLEVVDQGRYERAWEHASPLFQRQVSLARWVEAISAVREPLGDLEQRTVRSVTFRDSIPGAPDGEYAVLQFNAHFENKRAGVETITLMLVGRSWRVSGYFVR